MKGSPIEYAILKWLGRRSATDNKDTQAALQVAMGEVFEIVSKELALSEAEATAVKSRVITGSSLRASSQIGETKSVKDAFEVLKESVKSVTRRVVKEYRLEKVNSAKRQD